MSQILHSTIIEYSRSSCPPDRYPSVPCVLHFTPLLGTHPAHHPGFTREPHSAQPRRATPRESCQRRGVDAPVLPQRPAAPRPSLSTWLTPISSAILCLVSPTGRGQLPCDTRLRLRRPILSRCSFQKAPKARGNIGFHVVTMPSWRAT